MTTVLVLLALVAAATSASMALRRRRPEDGVVGFRRRLDALSPDARSSVLQRSRRG